MAIVAACGRSDEPDAGRRAGDGARAEGARLDLAAPDSLGPDSSGRDSIIGRDSAFGPRFMIDSTGKLVPIPRKRPDSIP